MVVNVLTIHLALSVTRFVYNENKDCFWCKAITWALELTPSRALQTRFMWKKLKLLIYSQLVLVQLFLKLSVIENGDQAYNFFFFQNMKIESTVNASGSG